MALEEVLNASASYWIARIETLKQSTLGERNHAEEEFSEVANSLSTAISTQLEALVDELSNLRVTNEYTSDGIVREVLTVDIIASSIEVQAKDYLAMSGVASTTASPTATGSGSSPFTRFLNGLLSALGSLQQWLLNILRIATTLKEWTISGGVSAGSLGLASAELSITFGQ